LQPSQVLWDRRIELRLGHDPLFQLHKPGHGTGSTVNRLIPRQDNDPKEQSTRE
jgi:hypothetical protein